MAATLKQRRRVGINGTQTDWYILMVLPSKVTRPNLHMITNGRQSVKSEVVRGEVRYDVKLAVLMFYSTVVEVYSVRNFD